MCQRFSYGYKPVVAVTCVLCDMIILGRFHKKLCPDCQLKWGRKTPRRINEELNEYGSFGRPLPPDLFVWSRIVSLRMQGIYSIWDL
jgi:hypothetical protein